MVEGAGTQTSIADDDRRDAVFLYSFAKAAKGAPHGHRERFVKPESESDFDCYASTLPDPFTLFRTMALYRLIAEGRFDFEYDHRVNLLANACERLENANHPSLKELFEICFRDDKYDPRKARARLAALPLIFVLQPREGRGGFEQIVYSRPQGGDSDISKLVGTITILTRKNAGCVAALRAERRASEGHPQAHQQRKPPAHDQDGGERSFWPVQRRREQALQRQPQRPGQDGGVSEAGGAHGTRRGVPAARRVRGRGGFGGDGDRRRRWDLGLKPELLRVISAFLAVAPATFGYTWRLPRDDKKWNSTVIDDLLQRVLATLGVSAPAGYSYSAHSLRSGAASAAFEVGVDIIRICYCGGWAQGSQAVHHYIDLSRQASAPAEFFFGHLRHSGPQYIGNRWSGGCTTTDPSVPPGV